MAGALTESENRGFASAADPTTAALRRKVRRFMGGLGESNDISNSSNCHHLGESWWNWELEGFQHEL
jgi:hypothetical protein